MIFNYFQHTNFAYPFVLPALLAVPLLILWYVKKNADKQSSITLSSLKQVENVRSWKTALRHLPFALRCLALTCLIVALARPQIRNDEQRVTGEGVDIILTIDVSGSMRAQDFTPNRLEAAKAVAASFIDNRPTDRIGIVIFSGESFTVCPLTTDANVLKTQLYNINSGVLEDGTAIGSGLATSVDRLRSAASKSKVIILLTDGENNGGQIPPLTATEIAKSVGVRVYTIGVGTDGYAPVPIQTMTGEVITQNEKVNIDEKLLQQIASETGGKYFRAKDNTGLQNVYKEIDRLEKTKIEVTKIRRYTEKFYPLAIAAAVLLLLELLLRYTILRKFP